jgi:hypothetical protein
MGNTGSDVQGEAPWSAASRATPAQRARPARAPRAPRRRSPARLSPRPARRRAAGQLRTAHERPRVLALHSARGLPSTKAKHRQPLTGCEDSTGNQIRSPGAQDRRSHAVHQPSETPMAAYQPEFPQARGREELAGDCSRGEGRRQVPDDETDGSRAPGIHTASLALKHAACQQRGLPGARRRRAAVLRTSKPATGALRRQQPRLANKYGKFWPQRNAAQQGRRTCWAAARGKQRVSSR